MGNESAKLLMKIGATFRKSDTQGRKGRGRGTQKRREGNRTPLAERGEGELRHSEGRDSRDIRY